MKAATDTVILMHYDLAGDGEAVETSRDGEPMRVLLGHGHLIEGLERAIHGHESGETFQVRLPPEEAYGEHHEGAIQRVSRKYFLHPRKLKPGMTTVLTLREGGQRAVTVHKVGMTTIDVDTNHPMAGKTLLFDIELLDVRAATPEEIEHGHVHATDATGS